MIVANLCSHNSICFSFFVQVPENLTGRAVPMIGQNDNNLIIPQPLDKISHMFDWQNEKRPVASEFGTFDQNQPMKAHQVIDISCNTTGKPHQISRESVPMYVNEVSWWRSGPDNWKRREANVIAHHPNGRNIQYLFQYVAKGLKKTSINAPGKSCCMELLVDYGGIGYESIRERKGYGKSNLSGKIKSDEHRPTLLLRNFLDRQEIFRIIEQLGIRQLYETLEFLELQMHSKILEIFQSYFLVQENLAQGECFA